MTSPSKPASPWAVKLAKERKEQGLPLEKIRQTLVLEGLEPELINSVVKGDGGYLGEEGHVKPISPPASPQRRQLSAR